MLDFLLGMGCFYGILPMSHHFVDVCLPRLINFYDVNLLLRMLDFLLRAVLYVNHASSYTVLPKRYPWNRFVVNK
jgi:hypothetical protein